MEEEWWEEEGGERPESIEIVAAAEEPDEPDTVVFSGEVSSFKVGDSDVLGTAEDPGGSGLSDGTWFAIGLLLAPMAVGLLSFVLMAVGDSLTWQDWEENSHYDSVLIERGYEDISGESYRLYEADFPDMDPSYFDSADVNLNSQGYDCHLYDWPSSDDWVPMDCYAWNGRGTEVYAKLDEGAGITFAVDYDSDSDRPTSASLWEYHDGGASVVLGEILIFLSLLVWPIGLIAGLVWGFTKGSKHFAYGMLASIIVDPVICFGALFILVIVAFGW